MAKKTVAERTTKTKAAPKEKTAAATKEKKAVDENMVSLSDLCEEYGIDPRSARIKLRKEYGSSGERWAWKKDSKDLSKVVELLTREPAPKSNGEAKTAKAKATKPEAKAKAKAAAPKVKKIAKQEEAYDDDM